MCSTERRSAPRGAALLVPVAILASGALHSGCAPCKDRPAHECSSTDFPCERGAPVAIKGTTATSVAFDYVTGEVSWKGRNASDWVEVKVPGEGTLTVEFNWDDPRCKCSIVIAGDLCEDLARAANRGRREAFSAPTKAAGPYRVGFLAEGAEAASAYSAKITWTRAAPAALAPVCGDGVCHDSETATCAADCAPKAVCGDGVCAGGETKDTCPADCKKKWSGGPPPPPPPAKKAKITRVLPPSEGDPVVITINLGSADGIAVGMTGSLVGLPAGRFKVVRVFATSCEAHLKGVAVGVVKEHPEVVFD